MENNKNISDFFMNIKNDIITLIVGNSGSGKSFLVSMICEYYLLENKPCVVIDTTNDESIIYRINKSYNLINRKFSFTHIKIL